MNVVIIGTGMYVCGRGTDGFGTILPAIYEWKRHELLNKIYISGAHRSSIEELNKKVIELNKLLDLEIHPHYYPENTDHDPRAYKTAIKEVPRPACAIIVVPDDLHREIAGYAIENNLHTLVVKPLAPTINEVNELIEIQQDHNVYCAVEFHKRLDRSNLMLRDSIKSGRIGDILYFIIEYSQRKSVPIDKFQSWVSKTNVFQYLGIHYVDIIYFATRAVPLRVIAIGQKNILVKKGIDTYDAIQVTIEWQMPSGKPFTSSIFTNWVDPEQSSSMSDQKIKVIGTKGRYEANQKKRGIVITDNSGIEEPNPDFCTMYGTGNDHFEFKGYGIDSIKQFLFDVSLVESGDVSVDELEGKRPTFKDAIVPTVILDAVNRSLAENGKWIETKLINNQFDRYH